MHKKTFFLIFFVGSIFFVSTSSSVLAGELSVLYRQITDSFARQYQAYQETMMPYDLATDESITKFVSANVGFEDPLYTPVELVLVTGEYLSTHRDFYLRPEALQALQNLSEEFFEHFDKKIGIVSAYRPYTYQQGLFEKLQNPGRVALPGHSEHQAGLAVDLFYVGTQKSFMNESLYVQYYERLLDCAHLYGFHNTYQKGISIDSYHPEPWHWRYVGTGLATLLYQKGRTLAEYYEYVQGLY